MSKTSVGAKVQAETADRLADAFVAELDLRASRDRASATRRLGRRVAVITLAYALALLDGSAIPALDPSGLAQSLAADGNTVDEIVQGASILFGLTVTHLVIERYEKRELVARAVNEAILGWLAPTLTAFARIDFVRSAPGSTPAPRLTRREREVLAALAISSDSEAVCARLTISAHTLRHHISSLCDKFGARNRFELLLMAQRNGIA